MFPAGTLRFPLRGWVCGSGIAAYTVACRRNNGGLYILFTKRLYKRPTHRALSRAASPAGDKTAASAGHAQFLRSWGASTGPICCCDSHESATNIVCRMCVTVPARACALRYRRGNSTPPEREEGTPGGGRASGRCAHPVGIARSTRSPSPEAGTPLCTSRRRRRTGSGRGGGGGRAGAGSNRSARRGGGRQVPNKWSASLAWRGSGDDRPKTSTLRRRRPALHRQMWEGQPEALGSGGA